MCRMQQNKNGAVSAASPENCPFSITQINQTTYLIRENDSFGEYPHIYAKICKLIDADGRHQSVIVLSDTGVGTTVKNKTDTWTIKTFLELHLNKNSSKPYMVILSHCHYDHILGLEHLLPSEEIVDRPHVTIVSSSHDPSFVEPYETLNKHSLCEKYNVRAPKYSTDIWATDEQNLKYTGVDFSASELGITILHTPGHTPDSLTWYDSSEKWLFVGDSFYQQTSLHSKNASWGPELPAPIIFTLEGDLFDWWESVKKLLTFVKHENRQSPLVKLAAGHVTAGVDAHNCLSNVQTFMAKLLRGELVCERLPDREGQRMCHWKDQVETDPGHPTEFSVVCSEKAVRDGRARIPKDEWTVV